MISNFFQAQSGNEEDDQVEYGLESRALPATDRRQVNPCRALTTKSHCGNSPETRVCRRLQRNSNKNSAKKALSSQAISTKERLSALFFVISEWLSQLSSPGEITERRKGNLVILKKEKKMLH